MNATGHNTGYECAVCGAFFGVDDVYDQAGTIVCRFCFERQQQQRASRAPTAGQSQERSDAAPPRVPPTHSKVRKPPAKQASALRLVLITLLSVGAVAGGTYLYKKSRVSTYDRLIADAESRLAANDAEGAMRKYRELHEQVEGRKVPPEAVPKLEKATTDWHALGQSMIDEADAARRAGNWEAASLQYQKVRATADAGLLPDSLLGEADRAAGSWKRIYLDAIDVARAAGRTGDFAGANTKYREVYAMARRNLFPPDAAPQVKAALDDWARLWRTAIADARAKTQAGDLDAAKQAYGKLWSERGKEIPGTVADDVKAAMAEAGRVLGGAAP